MMSQWKNLPRDGVDVDGCDAYFVTSSRAGSPALTASAPPLARPGSAPAAPGSSAGTGSVGSARPVKVRGRGAARCTVGGTSDLASQDLSTPITSLQLYL